MSVTDEGSTIIIVLISVLTVVLLHYLYKTYFMFIHREAVLKEQVVKNPGNAI